MLQYLILRYLILERIIMTQLLIHLPDSLASRFRSRIPAKQRSKYIEHLLSVDLEKQDHKLLAAAMAIEDDTDINDLIAEFDVIIGDGKSMITEHLPQ